MYLLFQSQYGSLSILLTFKKANPLLFLDKHHTNVNGMRCIYLEKKERSENLPGPHPHLWVGRQTYPTLCIARGAPAVELNVWRWGMRRACRMRRIWVARGAHKYGSSTKLSPRTAVSCHLNMPETNEKQCRITHLMQHATPRWTRSVFWGKKRLQ